MATVKVIALPRVLPGELDLAALNARVRTGEARLDWRAVQEAPPASLARLLAGIDLANHAEALGIDTVPDALADLILDAIERSPRSRGRAPTRAERRQRSPDAASPALWPPPAVQPSLDLVGKGAADSQSLDRAADDSYPRGAGGNDPNQTQPAAVVPASSGVLAAPSPVELRRELAQMVALDLLGPAGGEDEEMAEEQVRDRYLLGMLAPRATPVLLGTQDTLATAGSDTSEDGTADDSPAAVPAAPTLFPSSFGLTCSVAGTTQALCVTARWGRYERVRSETLVDAKSGNPKTIWKRQPMGGTPHTIALREGELESFAPDPEQTDVLVRGEARRLDETWIVTLFLVNEQDEPKKLRDRAWLFQSELIVTAAEEGAPVFCRHPLLRTHTHRTHTHRDPIDCRESDAMAMLYRHHVEFAVGHGVGVHATPAPGAPDRAIEIRTRALPSYEVAQTVAPTVQDTPALAGMVLDMRTLAEMPVDSLPAALAPLADAYGAWIEEQATRLSEPAQGLAEHRQAAQDALACCRVALERVRAGIRLLRENTQAAEAFRFMNRAMWQQRVHTSLADKVRNAQPADLATLDVSGNRSWRPFQLAFILLNLPALTDLRHPDRVTAPEALADLLWFPTGGGKTEAYLGLTAFVLAIRRLQGTVAGRSGQDGVAVLMRYTLRLLTLQQFQRAAALLCACELIRQEATARGDRRWGTTPFRLGLWVGQQTTPNTTEGSDEAIREQHGKFRPGAGALGGGGGGSPAQLTNCPWCGTSIDPRRDIKVEKEVRRTLIYCGDPLGRCPFSARQAPGEGLPVLVVDEEIYRQLPSLVIATVDKFAQMPWKGPVGMLFGQVSGYCPRHGFRSPDLEDSDSHPARGGLPAVRTQPCPPLRPPDLIIQDELHLISGPLGTLVGLYETVVDRIATWELADGQRVRPKVIASTATIRRASEQVRALFLRQVEVFPPQGFEVEDNFFARQRSTSELPGRLYVGVCAPGRRMKQVLVRVYSTYLLAAQTLYERYGRAVDPWMTLVGYFNSMRELAGMRRLVDENVRVSIEHGDQRGFARRRRPLLEELTSRRASTDIPRLLDRMETSFDPTSSAPLGAQQQRQTASAQSPLDILLATNMISVGVDVKRLGLMVVADQPKTTAEYIQATSRVGRAFPGIVCTVFNWARPRDLSHYEQFEHYHDTFYAHIEALSVTPFAPRAIDRGLSALLATLVRQLGLEFNANARAAAVTREHPYVLEALATLQARAEHVCSELRVVALVRDELDRRLEAWLREAADRRGGRVLGYQEKRDGLTVPLLHVPDPRGWQLFTCLNSLRDVEPTVTLVLDEGPLGDDTERPVIPMTPPRSATADEADEADGVAFPTGEQGDADDAVD